MSSGGTNACNAPQHPYVERDKRAEEKKNHPIRYYSRKIGNALLLSVVVCPLVACVCCLKILCLDGGGNGLCGTGAMQAARQKRDARHRKANIPRALYHHQIKEKGRGDTWAIDKRALSKRRRLSFGQGDNAPVRPNLVQRLSNNLTLRPKQHMRTTPKSSLLSLPLEIRLCIWKHAVGGRTIHMFYGTPVSKQPHVFPLKASVFPIRIKRKSDHETTIKRLSSVECIHRADPTGWANRCPLMLSCQDCGVVWNSYGECSGKINWTSANRIEGSEDSENLGDMEIVAANTGWRPLALLQTCRMVYEEAITLLYATNTFHFAEDTQISCFPITLLPTRLVLVTSVSVSMNLSYARELDLGALPSQFPSLRSLQIDGQDPWGETGYERYLERSVDRDLPFTILKQIADKVGKDGRVLVLVNFDEGRLRNPEHDLPEQLQIVYETAETSAVRELFDKLVVARSQRENVELR